MRELHILSKYLIFFNVHSVLDKTWKISDFVCSPSIFFIHDILIPRVETWHHHRDWLCSLSPFSHFLSAWGWDLKIDILCESEGRPLAMWQVRNCGNRMTSQAHLASVNCQQAVSCQCELQFHPEKTSHLKCLNISNFTKTSGYAVSMAVNPTHSVLS